MKKSPAFTLAPRYNSASNRMKVPGPGAYSAVRGGEKPASRLDGAGFGSSKRTNIAEGKRGGPGPG